MRHPVQKLAFNRTNGRLYLAAGEKLQEFDPTTGVLVQEWSTELIAADETKDEQPKKKKAKTEQAKVVRNAFRTLSCSEDGRYIVGSTDELKSLVVLSTTDLSLQYSRKFPKRPSALAITDSNETLLLGDKFGDVYSLPIVPSAGSKPGHSKLSSAENESGYDIEPIFGHVSMLVDLLVTPEVEGARYAISSDRDEHVRVTRYPEACVIERFCFGHMQYVSQLLVPSWAPTTLLSGGGDDFLARWNWTTGELVEKIELEAYIGAEPSEEDSEFEVAVSGIWEIPELKIVLVFDDNSKKLLSFKIPESQSEPARFLSSKKYDLLDAAVSGTNGEAWLTVYNSSESEGPEIKKIKVDESGVITEIEEALAKKISETASFEIASRADVLALHPVSLLRKHAEH
ncbi:hypothetical protein BZA70DRAFT_280568 [Myxozyma melibiosi]|uniref:Transfer RNA methyltransferase 82 n=1 Tax=Myxozyma melibiosi TaxID=54550 RepID=A0ABR1F3E1_9ASCO